MTGTEAQRAFETALRQAGELPRAVVERGVVQRYFVPPILPMHALTPEEIGAAWTRLGVAIKEGRAPELLSLYLHIPFCAHRCRYCVYYSVESTDDASRQGCLTRLRAELDHYVAALGGARFTTLYIGGGTPTVLSEPQLDALLRHIDATVPRLPGGEWAFECNPLSASETKARMFRDHGFNRVSFGVQSLNPAVLGGVDRGYQSAERVEHTFRVMQDCGFWINVDLLAGLPGDSPESLCRSVEGVLALGPHQITIYNLSPSTPMTLDARDGESFSDVIPRVEEVARRHGQRVGVSPTSIRLYMPEEETSDTLLRLHFRESGGEGRLYDDLTVDPYSLLGVGPTARSYVYGQQRYANVRAPVDTPFETQGAVASGRVVTMDEERRRYVVYNLEREGGVDRAAYEVLFGEPPEAAFGEALGIGLAAGGLKQEGGRISFASTDAQRRFATGLLFVDAATLEHARTPPSVAEAEAERSRRAAQERQAQRDARRLRGRNPAAEHATLELRSRGQSLQVVLTTYEPRQPCLHHRGRFAFYIPSDAPDGTGRLRRPQARMLRSFVRLFDQVVTRDRPADIAALRRRLLS